MTEGNQYLFTGRECGIFNEKQQQKITNYTNTTVTNLKNIVLRNILMYYCIYRGLKIGNTIDFRVTNLDGKTMQKIKEVMIINFKIIVICKEE